MTDADERVTFETRAGEQGKEKSGKGFGGSGDCYKRKEGKSAKIQKLARALQNLDFI